MSVRTVEQRKLRTGQPHTKIMASKKYEEAETDKGEKGYVVTDCLQVNGYTLEDVLVSDKGEDPVWDTKWEEHDLGQQPNLEEAYRTADDWRESLRGAYELR